MECYLCKKSISKGENLPIYKTSLQWKLGVQQTRQGDKLYEQMTIEKVCTECFGNAHYTLMTLPNTYN